MAKYIGKDTVVAEIKKIYNEDYKFLPSDLVEGVQDFKDDLLMKLDALEVKEVDYERELSKYVSNGIHRFFPNVDDDYCKMDSVVWQDYVIETAKHFFELALSLKNN